MRKLNVFEKDALDMLHYMLCICFRDNEGYQRKFALNDEVKLLQMGIYDGL